MKVKRKVVACVIIYVIAFVASSYLFTHDVDIDFAVRAKLKTAEWEPRQVAIVRVPRKYTEAKPPNARGSLVIYADNSVWYREEDEFAVFDTGPVFVVPDRYLAPLATAEGVIAHVKQRSK